MPDQSIPKPAASFRGSSQKSPGDLEDMAFKWAIPGLGMEPLATVSLYALRLIDADGTAYTANEIPTNLPDVIEADYIEVADREGLTIPDSSYGQKGGIPYFGDSPLADQLQNRLAFKDVVATVGAVGTQKFHIGGFPVGASQAINGQSWGVVVEITIDGIGASLPAVGQDMYLVIRLGTGAITLAQSTAIEITPAALYQKVRFIGEVSLSEVTGNLKPTLSVGFQELSQAAAFDTDSTYIPFAAATLINNTTANAPVNTATTLDFYFFGNWTVDDFYMVQFAGSIELLAEELIEGEFA